MEYYCNLSDRNGHYIYGFVYVQTSEGKKGGTSPVKCTPISVTYPHRYQHYIWLFVKCSNLCKKEMEGAVQHVGIGKYIYLSLYTHHVEIRLTRSERETCELL